MKCETMTSTVYTICLISSLKSVLWRCRAARYGSTRSCKTCSDTSSSLVSWRAIRRSWTSSKRFVTHTLDPGGHISWIMFLISACLVGVDRAAAPGPSAVRGGSQLSLDGCLALPDDASLSHPHRHQHAAGSQGSLQGEKVVTPLGLTVTSVTGCGLNCPCANVTQGFFMA